MNKRTGRSRTIITSILLFLLPLQLYSIQTDGFEKVKLSWDHLLDKDHIGYTIYRAMDLPDPLENPITIDGSSEDWEGLPTAGDSSYYPPEDRLHIENLWVTHDTEYLYAALSLSSGIYHAAALEFYLDLDQDKSTGSSTKNWRGLPIGADVMIYYAPEGTMRMRVWDPGWEGPYPYDEFSSGNYADPRYAWEDITEISEDFRAVFGSRPITGAQQLWNDNFLEMRIPLRYLGQLSSQTIDPQHIGLDMIVSTHADQFPTIGYAPGSPMFYRYGYEEIRKVPSFNHSIEDTVLDGHRYQYLAYGHDLSGKETPVNLVDDSVLSSRTRVKDFNVSIRDSSSLEISFTFPSNPQVEEVLIMRSEDHYPNGIKDGVEAFRIGALPEERITLADTGLSTAQSYYYAAYSISSDGSSSQGTWDVKDRSIPAEVRGRLEGFDEQSVYMAYFSSWDRDRVESAKKYDLVILHPGGGSYLIFPEQVDEIQRGIDGIAGTGDDVKVIGYVSIGEDFGIDPLVLEANSKAGRHPNLSDYPEGSWSIGSYYYPRKLEDSTSGPVLYDYQKAEKRLKESTDPIEQFPSFYIDMIDYSGQGGAGHDGLPDQNTEWGGLYVDPGNEDWQTFIKEARIEEDYIAGLDWVLSDEGLGCDGVFLDTVGISATWSQWFPFNYFGEYYWTADGFLDFFAKIGTWYPDKIIMPNRPMHFLYPGMAGSRYDDFRSLIDAFFWESYSPDMFFWWGGNYAHMLEGAAAEAQSDEDGRGFTTFIMDYWNVMIDAEEGGGYQQAPWYRTIEEQIEFSEKEGFISYVTTSRSMAEFADFVYYAKRPEARVLPDIFVHSIETERLNEQRVHVTANITNQGRPIPEGSGFTVELYHNGRLIEEKRMSGLGYLEIQSFETDIILQDIGNDIRVTSDADDEIEELDEQEFSVEGNNTKHRYVDRYLEFEEDWFPEGFAPDVEIEDVWFSNEYPLVGEQLQIDILYRNISTEGISTASRLYYWMIEGNGSTSLGNIPTPFLLPGETKIISIPYTPSSPGKLSLGIVADGTFSIIEQREKNNFFEASRFIVSPGQEDQDLRSMSLGPFFDIIGDGTDSEGAADIKWVRVSSDPDRTYLTMETTRALELDAFNYLAFIERPGHSRPGYPVSSISADIMVSDGALWEYTGEFPGQWSWERMKGINDLYFSVNESMHELEIGIPNELLYEEELERRSVSLEEQIQIIFYISDGINETIDDIYPSYSSAVSYPALGASIRIDGNQEDWEQQKGLVFSGAEGTGDGIAKSGKAVGSAISRAADIKELRAMMDEDYLYLRLSTAAAVRTDTVDYSIYIDADRSDLTGYRLRNDTFGAEFRILNGELYGYAGEDGLWGWELIEGKVFSSQGSIFHQDSIEIALLREGLFAEDSTIELFLQTTDKQGAGWEDDIDDFFPDKLIRHFLLPVTDYTRASDDFWAEIEQENSIGVEASYQFASIGDAILTTVSMKSIDGNLLDWSSDPSVTFIGNDVIENRPAGTKILDIEEASFVFHDRDLFLKIEVSGVIDELDDYASIYLNSDGSIATGYTQRGYDHRISGDGRIYALADGTRYSGTFVDMVPIRIAGKNRDVIELGVPGRLVGEFAEEFTVYFRFGEQEGKLTDYDEFGPFRLSRDNLMIETPPPVFPVWIILTISIGFFSIAVFLNIRIRSKDSEKGDTLLKSGRKEALKEHSPVEHDLDER